MGSRYSRSYFNDWNARSRTPFCPGLRTQVRMERVERAVVVGDRGDRHDPTGARIREVLQQGRRGHPVRV
jgi:hypothetical protein